MTLFWATIWVCILHFAFHSKHSDTQSPWTFISISMNLSSKLLGLLLPQLLWNPIANQNYSTFLLWSFHWDYFSRLHSDFKYDMLSFRARCFHRSVDLLLTKNTSLNAMWQSLTNLSNWPNDSIPEIKDTTSLYEVIIPMTPCSEGLVPAPHLFETCLKSFSSKENTSANLICDNPLVILTLTLIYSSGADIGKKEEFFILNKCLDKGTTFRGFFSWPMKRGKKSSCYAPVIKIFIIKWCSTTTSSTFSIKSTVLLKLLFIPWRQGIGKKATSETKGREMWWNYCSITPVMHPASIVLVRALPLIYTWAGTVFP